MLKRTFNYWTAEITKILYTTFVRPHIEYASSAWNPYRKKDELILDNVQRRATKLVPELKNTPNEWRLEIL